MLLLLFGSQNNYKAHYPSLTMKRRVDRKRVLCFSQGIRKKGISAIMATVLIILITIVAIAIIWIAIILMIQQDFVSQRDILSIQLHILVSERYTVYDPEDHFAFVHIRRGSDEVNITVLEIIFDVEGNSYIYQTDRVPEPNKERVYAFNFTRDGIIGVPNSVGVAPVFIENSKRKIGGILDERDMPVKRATISPADSLASGDNNLKSDPSD